MYVYVCVFLYKLLVDVCFDVVVCLFYIFIGLIYIFIEVTRSASSPYIFRTVLYKT